MLFSNLELELVLGQEKGSDAASTMGTEAAVYAAEATDNNDLLERILPATISDYIDLVKSHICAGGCKLHLVKNIDYIQLHILT